MEAKEMRLLKLAERLTEKLDDIEAALQGTYAMDKALAASAEKPAVPIKDGLDMLNDSLQKSIARCDFLREQIEDIGRRI